MSAVSIVPAGPEHTEAARALVAELGYADLDPASFARGFADVLADATQRVWLAETDARVDGLMTLSWRPQMRLAGLVVSIDELVVRERARGTGMGALLLAHAKREAVRLGARRLELHTARTRASYARGFYVKNGFVEVDSAVLRWEIVSPWTPST